MNTGEASREIMQFLKDNPTFYLATVDGYLPRVRPIGFALAFGVAMDAFLIRTTFIPATMQLLGKHAWWLPRWLDRILPNVDVEGEKLNERLAAEDRKGREMLVETV